MSNKVTLKDAEQAHKAVVTSQQKQIAALYVKWADEMAAQAKKYTSSKNPSAALKAQQITQLEGALRKAGEQTANAVNNSVKQSMVRAAQSVVDNNAEWMKKLGFPENGISAAFSSVPTEIVQNIITGQVYEGGWSLAKSIWSDSEDTLSKAYQMVAGGIAENKSVYDIAKDLEQFVSPSAKKPWNYTFEGVDKVTGQKKTYHVYPKQVDYNAQRLARTLSQHAYQQTMVAVNKDNPFVQKIKWHSTGSRVCPICKARDGKIYPKDQVPMDHPNGMCILEPVYDKDVNQRLADWVNGKEDPSLDAYVKKFGPNVIDTMKALPRDKKYIEKPFEYREMPDYVRSHGKEVYDKSVKSLTKRYKMSVDEVQQKLDRAFASMVSNSDFGMHVSSDSLIKALRSGSFKSQHESGTSGGYFNPKMRLRFENSMFNVPIKNGPGMKDSDRPVYGLLVPKYDGSSSVKDYYNNGPGSWYGDGITVVFKRGKVLNQATMTIGDSFDYSSDIQAILASDPKCTGSFNAKKVNELLMQVDPENGSNVIDGMIQMTSGSKRGNADQYIEVQLHGEKSHSVDNVQKVFLDRRQSSNYTELLKVLDEKKIPYEWIE